MPAPLVILGTGGVSREFHEVVEDVLSTINSEWEGIEFLGFIGPDNFDPKVLGVHGPWLGTDAVLQSLPQGTYFVSGVGSSQLRRSITQRALKHNLRGMTLIHSSAHIGKHNSDIGEGSVIAAQASVSTNVTIGSFNFIDRSVTIGHDTILGDFVSVYPGASISGNVHIENGVTVGSGARILQGLHIGENSFIGAGAVVTRDVEANTTVVGVPARRLHTNVS